MGKKTNTNASPKKEQQKPLSRRKLWFFRIVVLVVVPVLVLLGLEFALRLAGFGYPAGAVIEKKVNGQRICHDNVKFGWRFFPKNISREFLPFFFPAQKPENTCRIFILGSSAAQGIPDGAYNFGRFLEVMLRKQYPAVNFEVINTAMTAVNSHVILQVARDCSAYQPDVFIIYAGNNEVVGPYGAGTIFSPISGNLKLIRLSLVIKTTRLGQLLARILESRKQQVQIPKIWGGMEMFVNKQIRIADKDLQLVYKHYRENLIDICKIGQKKGIKIVLSNVVCNLKDSPPFASLHREDFTESEKRNWDDLYRQGRNYMDADKFSEAAESFLQALKIDGAYADLHYLLACCYYQLHDFQNAYKSFSDALEYDTIRLRADSRINQVIRDIASDKESKGIFFADTVSAFEKQSEYKIAGEKFFYEHVHFNFSGNYLLAKTIYQQLEIALPDWVKKQKVSGISLPSQEDCAKSLAFTDWDRYKIADEIFHGYLIKAPFTNQLFHSRTMKQKEQELAILRNNLTSPVLQKSAAQYVEAIGLSPSDWYLYWKYGQLLSEDLNDGALAAMQFRKVLSLHPQFYVAYVRLGMILSDQGNFNDAVSLFSKAIKIKPTYPDAYYDLALMYHQHGLFESARNNYLKALQLEPTYAQAYINYGVLLYQQEKIDEAIENYRLGLSFVSDSRELHYNLGVLLETKGQKKEAAEQFRAALKIDPNYIDAQQNLMKISL